MIFRHLAAAVIGLATLLPALAHSYRTGDLLIGHLSAQPAQDGETGKLFVPILNKGPARETLVGIETPVAESVELWLAEDGAKRVDEVALEPKVVLNMLPGGRFVKLVGLRQPLRAGEKFPVTLVFRNAGPVAAEAWVEEKPSQR